MTAEQLIDRYLADKGPGPGKRFKNLSKKLVAKGARDPDALAAYIGRKKYGKDKFQKMAADGRKK